jgi:flagellar motility protein MotE (MotC chaperone)
MKVNIPTPRLLPLTILALAALLAVKSVWLLRAWPNAVVSAAQAAEHAPKPAEAPPKPAPPAAPEPAAPPAPPPISDSERAVLLELRQRRQELERRDATIAARESVLTATEQKITARVEELRALQSQLAGLDTARQQREDANWQSLVKVYETMKPREAAAIFNDLTMPVLLPLIGRMKEAKAAAILAAMTPDKAREVTAQLAKSKGRLDTMPAPPLPKS